MALWVYDGASAFDLDAAKANGGVACTGYIVGNPGGFNHIDKARVDQIRAKGMGFSPNWERAADAFLTYSVGECGQAGVEAMQANKALGVPDGVRTSFSIDTQVPVSRFPEMAQKLDAAQAGMGGHYPAFLYGQSNLIDWLGSNPVRTKIRGKHWLMMSTWNQPYNIRSPYVCMVQEHNLDGTWHSSPVPDTDSNLLIDPYALGAWWPDGSPYASSPQYKEDDMILIIRGTQHYVMGNGIPLHIMASPTDENAYLSAKTSDGTPITAVINLTPAEETRLSALLSAVPTQISKIATNTDTVETALKDELDAIKALPTADALATAIAAKLGSVPGGGPTPLQIKQSVKDALAEGTGKLP